MTVQKSERLLNLLIMLLVQRRHVPKDRIREILYPGSGTDAFEKMFERDKEELRSLGVPIEVGSLDAFFDDEPGYRIRPDEFALPDVSLEGDEAAVLAAVRSEVEQVGGALDVVLGGGEPSAAELAADDVAAEDAAAEDAGAEDAATDDLPDAPEVDVELEFQAACDRGVDALLQRDFVAARRAFLDAERWQPGDRLVTANLARLAAMGIGAEAAPEGGRQDG